MAKKKRLVKFPGTPYHAFYGYPWYWGYGDDVLNNNDTNAPSGTDYPTGDVGINGGGFDGEFGGFDGGADCGGGDGGFC